MGRHIARQDSTRTEGARRRTIERKQARHLKHSRYMLDAELVALRIGGAL